MRILGISVNDWIAGLFAILIGAFVLFESSSYSMGPLSVNEVALKSFTRRMRDLIPQSREPVAPPPGWGKTG